jgi:hypothetical protein
MDLPVPGKDYLKNYVRNCFGRSTGFDPAYPSPANPDAYYNFEIYKNSSLWDCSHNFVN